jgi:hypothetical protein
MRADLIRSSAASKSRAAQTRLCMPDRNGIRRVGGTRPARLAWFNRGSGRSP